MKTRVHAISLFLVLCLSLCLAPIPSDAAAPPPAWGEKGMVATAHPLATKAAREVLEEGGNAVDAALAAIYTLDVVTHYSEGLGGGEFWVVHLAEEGRVLTIDGRESAPAAATRDMYLDSTGAVIPGLSTYGALAGGVPGSVAAREHALEHFGSLPRQRLLRNAIDAAANGFELTPHQAAVFQHAAPYFERFPSSREVMLKEDGSPWRAGDLFLQQDLAKTLRRIAKGGAEEFYRGETAEMIASFLAENGGLITNEDLANYEPIVREPIHGTYRGYDVYSMPPPSSGGVHLVQMLNILEGWDLEQFERYSSRYYHHLAEAMEAAFADRAVYLGDPAFVNVPVEGLTAKSYADELRQRIHSLQFERNESEGDPMRHMDTPPDSLLKPSHTSHLSVIDQWGNMVALTSSVNTHFGSKLILGETGIFLNNTMDDFSLRPGYPNYFGLVGSEANAVAPGKRPLSSMSPTLVLHDGDPFLAVGGAGGPKIITGTLQTVLNIIDFGADPAEAVHDPRIHHQWKPNYLFVDREISPDCVSALFQLGHHVYRGGAGSVIQTVLLDPETGLYFGAADPRAGGSAEGVME